MMPLPWKKTKVARISRLVADLQSPKRGGSLVVQTGFPTSLVDLFVKNRDRLKKQSKKKSQSQSQSQTYSEIEISNPILKGTPTPTYHNLTVNSSSSRPRNEITTTTHVQEFTVGEEFDERGGCGGCGSNRNSILVAVLKIFVVMILALSTKRLAVGVTMSAILLLLLEYVGARGLFYSKATTFLVSFLPKVKSNKDVFSLKKTAICEEISRSSGCELVDDTVFNSSLEEEIQVEEVRIDDQRRRCLDMESRERIVVEEEEVKREDVLMTIKNERSRGAKIKEKLVKRLVPKKLRCSKNAKKKNKWLDQVESSNRVSGFYLGEDILGRKLEQKHDHEDGSSIVSLEEEAEEGRGGSAFSDDMTCLLSKQSQAAEERMKRRESERNSGYVILILIVLAGLVGGRFLALLLTLGWCLMLKFVGKSRLVSCY
ncbi:hypothetical protein JRO89_XS06G0004200 [Xanthoceras sorbifolium]|uniref:Ethylene-responsive nuclear protein n=1 Tax=Xanthoceras sorbifolium TaxID=99658 RepID=A0ABQ8HVW4_9ROSI|nr:hypothetical protein JRO89_XS06G0004200 [Xanthoceras sorbifolium]